MDESLEKRTNIELKSYFSVEEREIFSVIVKKFFSPIFEILKTITSEKTKKEIEEENRFESSNTYSCLVNFVEKFGNDQSGDNFNKLKKLLNSKGFYFDDACLKGYINQEIKNCDYSSFKKFMLTNSAATIEDHIKKFVSIYYKQLVLLRDYKKKYDTITGAWEKLTKRTETKGTETWKCIRSSFSGTMSPEASKILDSNETVKFASEMTIKVSFLKKWFSERKMELKDDAGLDISIDELLQMIIDKLNEFELKRFEASLAKGEGYSIESVDVMNGYTFESFLKTLFEKMGYIAEQTKLSGDQGADLLVSKFGESMVVQAKRSNDKIGNNAIQEIVASINYYNAQKGMVVTNNEFTPAAVDLAKSNKITLVDRSELDRLIKEYL